MWFGVLCWLGSRPFCRSGRIAVTGLPHSSLPLHAFCLVCLQPCSPALQPCPACLVFHHSMCIVSPGPAPARCVAAAHTTLNPVNHFHNFWGAMVRQIFCSVLVHSRFSSVERDSSLRIITVTDYAVIRRDYRIIARDYGSQLFFLQIIKQNNRI